MEAEFVREVGKEGSGLGEFRGPMDLAFHNSEMYVLDYENHRVQVFSTESFEALRVIKLERGEGHGGFKGPIGIAISAERGEVSGREKREAGDPASSPLAASLSLSLFPLPLPHVLFASFSQLFVSEQRRHCITVLSIEGVFHRSFGHGEFDKCGDGQLQYPQAICLNSRSTELFVTDTGNRRIQVLTPGGAFLRKWGAGELDCPQDIKISASDEEVFVADGQSRNCVCVYRPDGTPLRVLGESLGLLFPVGIALSANGTVFVGEFYQHCVQELTCSDGTVVRKWGSRGNHSGEFLMMHGVAVGSKGEVFVCDTGNHRVQVFALKN